MKSNAQTWMPYSAVLLIADGTQHRAIVVLPLKQEDKRFHLVYLKMMVLSAPHDTSPLPPPVKRTAVTAAE